MLKVIEISYFCFYDRPSQKHVFLKRCPEVKLCTFYYTET